jgi:hypothetical protein
MSSQAAPSQNPEFVPTNHQISDWMKDIIMSRSLMEKKFGSVKPKIVLLMRGYG